MTGSGDWSRGYWECCVLVPPHVGCSLWERPVAGLLIGAGRCGGDWQTSSRGVFPGGCWLVGGPEEQGASLLALLLAEEHEGHRDADTATVLSTVIVLSIDFH